MSTSKEAVAKLSSGITQFLSDDEYMFTETFGSWTATNASLSVEKLLRFRNQYNTMRVTPTSGTSLTLSHEPKRVSNAFARDAMTLTVFVYPLTTINASVTLSDSLGGTETSQTVSLPALKWSLVRGPELRIQPTTITVSYSSTVNLSNTTTGSYIYIAHPAFINSFGFMDNQFVRECFTYMPPVFSQIDSEQSDPTFPMARLMDVGLAYAKRGFNQSIDFRYVDIENGYDQNDDTTKSTLVDYERTEPEYLPWLAQFVGVKLLTTPAGTTPWGNLPTTWEDIQLDIDPAADITYAISSITRTGTTVVATTATSPTGISIGQPITITGTTEFNGQFTITDIDTGLNTVEWESEGAEVTESSGSITYVDESWIEIEAFDTADANFIPGRRDLIKTARTGLNAGSKQAIIDAVKPILIGDQQIEYNLDPYTDPWLIQLRTLTAETIAGVTGEESEKIIRAVQQCRPLGFVITHECVESF